LNQQFGWDLETEAKVGQAISSVVRNDHGNSVPYESALWITFYRRARGGKRDDVQLFVRLDSRGVAAGLSLGRRAREAGRQFRKNIQQYAEALFHALAATDALTRCRFLADDGQSIAIESAADLRKWATSKTPVAERLIPHDDPVVRSDDLVGNIILIFDRLLPAYHCAVDEDPNRALGPSPAPAFDAKQFYAATYLNASWLQTATSLLSLKQQLILQGVSGTGKTHVARSLARLLTGCDDDRVRLVQFHPAFSYEEFVEGIKARTVEIDGRHEVTYPVEDGVLCQFAAQATARPGETFVLLIDEINRGNLPRVFGELLYLLEYRDQEITLPYSRRRFRLPRNLYLIGTMNAADRSVALVDLALRRRFSFLEMPPDARVLASWLEGHPPGDEAFGPRVVALFERLNQKLADDLGGVCQIGHSHFMVRDLNPERLGVVWDHHVRPVLAEYFAGYPQRLTGYELKMLMES
jgi:5-methylcytosine-specific restriction enzyme B